MKTLKFTLAAVLIAAMFTACTKEGPVGPAGPAGATGPQGPSGVTGTYATFPSNPSDWSPSGSFLIAGYNATIIDQYVDANGVVMAYFQTSAMGTNQWAPLPDTYPISNTVEQTLTYNYDINTFTLQMQNSDGTVPAAPAAFTVKVVVIPTAVIKQHPNTNWKDYNVVKQIMNLPNN